MPKLDEAVINYAVYENNVDMLGSAKATLPDLTSLTQTISGAGLAGNIEAIIKGHFDVMSLTLNFRTTSRTAIALSRQEAHTIDLRVALQVRDTVTRAITTQNVKHIMVVFPKSYKSGTVAPASSMDGSGEYAVHYWATYIDGVKLLEIDPINFICLIDGVDYLADVRKALGK